MGILLTTPLPSTQTWMSVQRVCLVDRGQTVQTLPAPTSAHARQEQSRMLIRPGATVSCGDILSLGLATPEKAVFIVLLLCLLYYYCVYCTVVVFIVLLLCLLYCCCVS